MGNPPPPVLDLLVDVIDEFKEHFVDRLISGLAVMLVMMVLIGVGIVALYVPMGLGTAAGVIADDELIAVVGMLVGMAVGTLLMMLVVTVPLMPMYASMGRAVARSLGDGSDLGPMAAFETIGTDLGKVMGTALLQMVLVFAGLAFCYLPGLIVGFAMTFALPAVIVHGLGPVAAIKRSFEHVMAEPIWHLGFYAVTIGIGMVFPYVPFIGMALMYPFLLSFQLRAYIAVFGTD